MLSAVTACSGANSAAPSRTASGTPAPTSARAFSIEQLPVGPGDTATMAYGIWPFGVHGSSHALDGHPGFDIEYRLDAPVHAVTDGVVAKIFPDAHDPSRSTVELRHDRDRGSYLTDYTNLVSVPAAIVPGASVSTGQILGVAGAFSGGLSAMIHFQMADPTRSTPGVAESAIVSPADYVAPSARQAFDAIWRTAAYRAEWCEPFLTNSRASGFPMTRVWTLQAGTGAEGLTVGCPTDAADPDYTLSSADGATLETGTLSVGWSARPTTVDFRPSGGRARLGLYDIVGETMRLAVAAAGSPRPATLDEGATYTTR